MSVQERLHFAMMSLVHETLYGWIRDPFESLQAAGLTVGQTVLQVGCGPRHFTIPAAQIVGPSGSLYALDVSSLATGRVQDKARLQGVTNLTTVLADASRTGLPSDHFDLVFVFGFRHNSDEIRDELCRPKASWRRKACCGQPAPHCSLWGSRAASTASGRQHLPEASTCLWKGAGRTAGGPLRASAE